MQLLETLCAFPAPSGQEAGLTAFLLAYVREHGPGWRQPPLVVHDESRFQDCLLLVFGKPRTAVFCHLDSIGFMVRYGRELVPIGGPEAKTGYRLVAENGHEYTLEARKKKGLRYRGKPKLPTGTSLTFACNFRETATTVQSCYLDNRLGLWVALRLAETLEDGIIAFSCGEEHGGGTVSYLGRYLHDTYGVRQALVCDITWASKGVRPRQGCAISIRDSSIPRRAFVARVRRVAEASGIPFQLEVEQHGGSDGRELQRADVPWDWCFVGAAEEHVHTPDERVHKADIESMLALYRVLLREL